MHRMCDILKTLLSDVTELFLHLVLLFLSHFDSLLKVNPE